MASIFTQIVQGEIPCHRVHEDEAHLAFLDINPIQPGHVLVIPKREVDEMFDLPPDELAALWRFAQVVATQLKAETGCARIVSIVVGYEVPHVHVHLIPTHELEDFPIPPRSALDHGEAAGFAERMQARFA